MTDLQTYGAIYWSIGAIVILLALWTSWDEIFTGDRFVDHDLSANEMLFIDIAVVVLASLVWPAIIVGVIRDFANLKMGGK